METELKLSLSAQDLPRLLTHPLLAGAGSAQRLLNTADSKVKCNTLGFNE